MIDETTTSVGAPNGEYRINSEFDGKRTSEKISENSPIENHSCADLTKNLEEGLVVEINGKEHDNETKPKGWLQTFTEAHRSKIRWIRTIVLNFVYGGYFAWATHHFINKQKIDENNICDMQWCDGYGMLLLLTVLVYSCLFYFNVIKPLMSKCLEKPNRQSMKTGVFYKRILKGVLIVLILLAISGFIVYDTIGSRERLRSLLGIVILFGIGYVFSSDRSKIKWQTVINGIIFQFLLGIFCIRMETGRKIFDCFGEKTKTFFGYALQGSAFVYGDLVNKLDVFAFSVLPAIFFFSFVVSILYYYGAMQWIIRQLGSIFQAVMGTSICEGVIVAGNIFLGQIESSLLIKPYIQYLTPSEIHVVMASGFATVSGTVLAAYIKFGAEPSHLITSTVMAAPATLAFAKLIYPETEVSRMSAKSISMEKSKDKSVLDAASNGAFAAVQLIAGITANLIAFVAFMKFLNGAAAFFGMLVGHDYVSFEWFFGKLFMPLAYIIGIPFEDCEQIGAVIGSKTIVNEFVAFEQLGKLKAAEQITKRSAAIATFAICGFANFCSLGMVIGNLGAMCPERRSMITSISVRALVSGSIICFLNASIAGLLISDEISA